MDSIIERPSMVLLIDCWSSWDDPANDTVRQCYQNIRSFCKTNPHIHTIGLATYRGEKVFNLGKEEPWYSNSHELFYSSTRWEQLRRSWGDVVFDDNTYTHEIIRDLDIRDDQSQFLIWNQNQLLYYCNHVFPIIENIYVLGIASDVCLESAPIGWRELTYLNRYNLFSTPKNILSKSDCILPLSKQFVTEVAAPWKKLHNNITILDQDQI